jgi:nitrite reductase/ring-hydroxylating ferredoxin subunit
VEAKDGQAQVRIAAGRTVTAGHVVVATNTPFNDRFVMHTKQAAYRTYAIAAAVPRGTIPTALYWDTEDPYHYVRLHAGDGDRELLIVGGEDHKTGQADDPETRFARLEAWAHERFPAIATVTHHWSGQVVEPVDGVAFIGRNPLDESNVYIATGDSGMGMTHGTIAGMLLCDLIAGRENEWAALYDPSRKSLRALPRWLSENLNVAGEITALVTPGEVSTIEEIPRGSGAVIRRGFAKVATYRDEDGVVHERSAICPHLGCVVVWNASEKSWDCPCHGSRFDALGRVVNGPAASDLSPLE